MDKLIKCKSLLNFGQINGKVNALLEYFSNFQVTSQPNKKKIQSNNSAFSMYKMKQNQFD